MQDELSSRLAKQRLKAGDEPPVRRASGSCNNVWTKSSASSGGWATADQLPSVAPGAALQPPGPPPPRVSHRAATEAALHPPEPPMSRVSRSATEAALQPPGPPPPRAAMGAALQPPGPPPPRAGSFSAKQPLPTPAQQGNDDVFGFLGTAQPPPPGAPSMRGPPPSSPGRGRWAALRAPGPPPGAPGPPPSRTAP